CDRPYSVDELARELCGRHNISISSIYRNVNKMVKEGSLAKLSQNNSRKFLYQYIGARACHEHLHLKCQRCGRLFHMDDRSMEGILKTVMKANNFSINREKTVLYGDCQDCRL
ncbi:MAG: hypothetical protein GX303_07075, partial [Clostridiales bacterium]|nr:hypothetical protein [Clostridiales bacterium]